MPSVFEEMTSCLIVIVSARRRTDEHASRCRVGHREVGVAVHIVRSNPVEDDPVAVQVLARDVVVDRYAGQPVPAKRVAADGVVVDRAATFRQTRRQKDSCALAGDAVAVGHVVGDQVVVDAARCRVRRKRYRPARQLGLCPARVIPQSAVLFKTRLCAMTLPSVGPISSVSRTPPALSRIVLPDRSHESVVLISVNGLAAVARATGARQTLRVSADSSAADPCRCCDRVVKTMHKLLRADRA